MNDVLTAEDVKLGFSVRTVCKRFFGIEADYAGYVNNDERVRRALRAGAPLVVAEPDAESESKSKSETVPSPPSPSGIDRQPTNASRAQSAIARRIGNRDASLTWSVVPWLRTITTLPVILKGVVTRDDARLAVEAERASLSRLAGSCTTPIAAFARFDQEHRMRMDGMVGAVDGEDLLRGAVDGGPE